jgi:hypothetical protein
VTREGLLVALAAVAAFRLFTRDWPPEGDAKALENYCLLVASLGLLTMIPFPKVPGQ